MNEPSEQIDKLSLEEEQFSEALEALLSNKPLPKQPLNPELAMALRLKTAQQKPVLRKDWARITEKLILNEFGKTQHRSFFEQFWRPVAAGLVFGGLMLAVLTPVLAPNLLNSPQTIAEVQDFESLSEAETLLGALPADAVTQDGLQIAELRQDLHDINVLRQSADTTLDENAETGSFPHTQLRDNALEVIEDEKRLVAMVDITVDIDTFAGKVAEWPITNEDVDYETHQKAVKGYLTHAKAWEMATLEWAEEVAANLK